ncbi:MAG: DUF1134 domain-containing protein [Desulfobaccales bacterium]
MSRLMLIMTMAALLFLAVSPGQSQEPRGTVTIDLTGIGGGLGLSWGSGTLRYEGRSYPFSIQGLRVGDVGISTQRAVGTVYYLRNLADFSGNYAAVGAGVAVAGGMAGMTMQNQRGVLIDLYSVQQGVQLNLGPQGFTIDMR